MDISTTDEGSGAPADVLAASLGALARDAAAAAGAMALAAVGHRDRLEFHEKSNGKQAHSDLVSQVDLDAQRTVRSTVLAARPDDAFLGEEDLGPGDDASPAVTDLSQVAPGQVVWVVDPVDATLNFSYGRHDWAVSVCAQLDGEPVASAVALPARGEMFCAEGTSAWLETVHGRYDLRLTGPADVARALVEVGRGKPSKLGWFVSAFDGHVRDLRRGGCAAAAICDVAAGRLDACVQADLGVWDWAGAAHVLSAAGGQVHFDGPVMVAAHPGLVGPVRSLLSAAEVSR